VERLLAEAMFMPWAADCVDLDDVVIWGTGDDPDGILIANVCESAVTMVGVARDADPPNARLLAAAPDLARALLDAWDRAESAEAALVVAEEARDRMIRLHTEEEARRWREVTRAEAAEAERDALRGYLYRAGWEPCTAIACNCGGWHDNRRPRGECSGCGYDRALGPCQDCGAAGGEDG